MKRKQVNLTWLKTFVSKVYPLAFEERSTSGQWRICKCPEVPLTEWKDYRKNAWLAAYAAIC